MNGLTPALLLGAAFFVSVGLVLLGLALGMFYEAVTYVTHLQPTISGLTAQELLTHPKSRGIWFLCIGILIGALATHFTNWRP